MPSPVSSLEQFERDYVRPKQGRTLIVGSQIYGGKEDRRKRYSDVVGVDMLEGPGVDVVLDLEDGIGNLGTFAHIECMSVLEHSRRPWWLAANLERVLEPGGTIFVSVPFIWRYHAYPSDYFRYSPEGIKALFPGIQWEHAMLAADVLTDGRKVKAMKFDAHPYLARTETVAFGYK